MRSQDTVLQKKASGIVSESLNQFIKDKIPSTNYKMLSVEMGVSMPTLMKVINNTHKMTISIKSAVLLERILKTSLQEYVYINLMDTVKVLTYLIDSGYTTIDSLVNKTQFSYYYFEQFFAGKVELEPKILDFIFGDFVDVLPDNYLKIFAKSCSRIRLLSLRTGLSVDHLVGAEYLDISDKHVIRALVWNKLPIVTQHYESKFLAIEEKYFKLISDHGVGYKGLPLELVALSLKI
jgi:hypothetical protein